MVSDYLYKAEANGRLESFFEDIVMLPPAHNAVFDLRHAPAGRAQVLRAAPREPARHAGRVSRDAAQVRRAAADRGRPDQHFAQRRDRQHVGGGAHCAADRDDASRRSRRPPNRASATRRRSSRIFSSKYPQFELEKSNLSEASFCEHYREIIFHMDEPFARQSAYVRWEIANLTAQAPPQGAAER